MIHNRNRKTSQLRKTTLGLMVAPLALSLAACGGKDEATTAEPKGEPVANIAAPAGTSWADTVVKTPEGGYRMGNPEAPIKLVEFAALSCSHCGEFSKESFEPLRDKYVASGRVSYELRYFMLNPFDVPATLLATCSTTEAVLPLSKQFWDWQPTMFQNVQAAGQERLTAIEALPKDQQIGAVAEVAGMTEFFASRGVARDQAKACLADSAKAKALAEQTQKASTEYNITGTPSFLVNGVSVGSGTWSVIETKLQQAGAR